MNATIKINGVTIRRGFEIHGWCYRIYEYRSPLTRRRGHGDFVSKSFDFFYHGDSLKPSVYASLSREASVFPREASKWAVSIMIHGAQFGERDLSLPAAFAKIKEWFAALDSITD